MNQVSIEKKSLEKCSLTKKLFLILGFFRIRRGTDECGFESIAVGADPVL